MKFSALHLREAMADQMMSVKALAEKTKLNPSTIYRILKGATPSTPTVKAFADALGVDVKALSKGFTQPNPVARLRWPPSDEICICGHGVGEHAPRTPSRCQTRGCRCSLFRSSLKFVEAVREERFWDTVGHHE